MMTLWAAVLTVLGLASLVAGADDSRPAFSIFLNVTGWSPFMIDTDVNWDMNSATGAITGTAKTWNTSTFGGPNILRMTGTRFEPFGIVEDLSPGTSRTAGNFSYVYRRGLGTGDWFTRWSLLQPFPEVGPLANPNNIELGTYTLRMLPKANTTVTISYVVIEVPVLTSAPNEQALRDRAQTARAIDAGQVNKAFTIRQFDSDAYEDLIPDRKLEGSLPAAPAEWEIGDDALELLDWTEMTYDVPSNTSIVNVTGPVFYELGGCYARLEPEPWWWNNVMPLAYPTKPAYRAGQTLFFLPTDPAVKYKLVIGSMGVQCIVSGVTTYAYDNALPSGTDATGSPISSDSRGSSVDTSRKLSAGVIIGTVIGSVAGVALLALAGVYWARRRRAPSSQKGNLQSTNNDSQFEETEEVHIIIPYGPLPRQSIDGAQHPQPFHPLGSEGMESASPLLAATKPQLEAPAHNHSTAPPVQANAHPLRRAEDMDDALLPPQYREAWSRPHSHSASIEDVTAVTR